MSVVVKGSIRRAVSLLVAVELLGGLALAPAAFAASAGTRVTALGQRALLATTTLALPVPATTAVTRADAVVAVVAVMGLTPASSATPTYEDVSPTSAPASFGAIEAAANAGLMVGWAGPSGDFEPNAPMSRIDLAILATNALGLDAKAQGLAGDETLYPALKDLSTAGDNLGFANAMLQAGVVPPVNTVRYMPGAAVTPVELAVALDRMWRLVDLPVAASLTATVPSPTVGVADPLTLAVTNRLGNPIPTLNEGRYPVAYTASGGSVTDGAFLAQAPGTYEVSAEVEGPLLPSALATTASIVVAAPAPAVITSVTFAGTLADPTITVVGNNFGTEPTAGLPATGGLASPGTGNDFGTDLHIYDATRGWDAGMAGDTIGILVSTYSDTSITFQLGSVYTNGYPGTYALACGDNFTMVVGASTYKGTIDNADAPQACPA